MTIGIDEFLKNHSTVPFRATIEAADGGKIKITPWRPKAGCLCNAALELPKEVVNSVTITTDEHVCCGKNLRVAQIEFASQHAPVLNAIFNQLQNKNSDSDCEAACSICRRFPWKTGPCSVCDRCIGAGGDQ